jgi:hypothetical protein
MKFLSTIDRFLADKSLMLYTSLVLLFGILLVFFEIKNGKFFTYDFRVYFDATNDFFKGNDPYIHNYGLDTGFFKYSPTTLFFFFPFRWGGYFIFQLLHTAILLLALLVSLPVLQRVIKNSMLFSEQKSYFLIVPLFVGIIHFTREFQLGNVNLILLALFTIGLVLRSKNKVLGASIFFSLIAILKPIMILAFIPLVIVKEWKMILFLLLFGAIYFILPAFFVGLKANFSLWNGWFKAVSAHGEYISSPHSLQYLVPHYLKSTHSWWYSLVGLLIVFIMSLIDYRTNKKDNRFFMVWTIIYTSFIPNFFVTDTQHFLLSTPLIMLLMYLLAMNYSKLIRVCFLIGVLCFSFNSTDLLGRSLSGIVNDWGLLGIGNLLFIASTIYTWRRLNKLNATSHNL